MNEINVDKMIAERYQTLPAEIKDLFEFGIVDKTLREIALNHSLNESQQIALENRLYLILLLFLPSTDLQAQVAEVLEIDQVRATLIADHLRSEVIDLIEEILEATDEKFVQNEITTPTSTTEITPVKGSNLTSIRTMEGDAKRIHGYGAFRQAEPRAEDTPVYHSEQAKLVPPPSYHDDSSTPPKP